MSAQRQGAGSLFVRRTWRTNWRSHAGLAIIVLVTVAVVVAMLIGAERAQSALDRLRSQTHAADLKVGLDGVDLVPVSGELAALDGVTAVGAIRELFVRPVGTDLFPDFNLLALAPLPLTGRADLDVPVIVSGRAPGPAMVDEIAMSAGLADELGLHVGDRLKLESMTSAWIDAAFNGGDPGPPDGPVVQVTLVGIGRSSIDFGRWNGLIQLTAAFADRYAGEIRQYTFLEAQLTDEFLARVMAHGGIDLPSRARVEQGPSYFAGSTATQDGLGTIAVALRLVAAITVLAGTTAIALTALRVARSTLADRATMAAIGWTRSEMTRVAVVVMCPWVIAGLLVGLGLAVVFSPKTLVGLARSVDPEPTSVVASVGWVLASAGACAVVLGAVMVFAARRASRSSAPTIDSVRRVAPLWRPVPVSLGIRWAFFDVPARGGRASRAAAAAATAAVAVGVAVLLVGASIQRLQDDPHLSGQAASERVIDAGEDLATYDRAMTALSADERIATLIGVHLADGVSAGSAAAPLLVFDSRRGDADATVLVGRLPERSDEVAVGPATLETLDLRVGDDLELTAGEQHARFRIVGEMLFPVVDNDFDVGFAMTVSGAEFMGGVNGTASHQVAFEWATDVDAIAADTALRGAGFTVFGTAQGLVPEVVSNLGQVKTLPPLLAVLAIGLCLIGIAHAASQTVRGHRRDTGTLRALGLTPRDVSATVIAHGALLLMIAFLVGLPAGVVLGRQVWSAIADRAHVVARPVVGWDGITWMAFGAVMVTGLLVALSAFGAIRERPASALKAE